MEARQVKSIHDAKARANNRDRFHLADRDHPLPLVLRSSVHRRSQLNYVRDRISSSTVSLTCSSVSAYCITSFQRNESAEGRRTDGAMFSDSTGGIAR